MSNLTNQLQAAGALYEENQAAHSKEVQELNSTQAQELVTLQELHREEVSALQLQLLGMRTSHENDIQAWTQEFAQMQVCMQALAAMAGLAATSLNHFLGLFR